MPTLPYITAHDLRQYLAQVDDDQKTTDLLMTIATRATSIVNEALGFAFNGYVSATRYVSGYGTPSLFLPPHEPGSISAVMWGSSTLDPSAYQEQEDGSLYRTPVTNLLLPFGVWSAGAYGVTANYGYGYTPESIVEVTIEVAVNIWRGKDRGMWTDIIGVEGAGGLRFTGGLTNQQRAIIEAVRARFNQGVPTI